MLELAYVALLVWAWFCASVKDPGSWSKHWTLTKTIFAYSRGIFGSHTPIKDDFQLCCQLCFSQIKLRVGILVNFNLVLWQVRDAWTDALKPWARWAHPNKYLTFSVARLDNCPWKKTSITQPIPNMNVSQIGRLTCLQWYLYTSSNCRLWCSWSLPVGSDIVKKNVELDGPGDNSYPWDNNLDLNQRTTLISSFRKISRQSYSWAR